MRVSSPTSWIRTLPCPGRTVSKPASYGFGPAWCAGRPHQPPSLTSLIVASVAWPAAGEMVDGSHVFAAPVTSAANTRSLDPAGPAFGAHAWSSAPARTRASHAQEGVAPVSLGRRSLVISEPLSVTFEPRPITTESRSKSGRAHIDRFWQLLEARIPDLLQHSGASRRRASGILPNGIVRGVP